MDSASAAGSSTNLIYDQFSEMTEALLKTLQKPSSGALDQKIYTNAQKWVEFYQQNQTAIAGELKKNHQVEPFVKKILLINEQLKSLPSDHLSPTLKAPDLQQLLVKIQHVSAGLRGMGVSSTPTLELPRDVLQETLTKLPNFKELVRAGIINKAFRNIVLDITTWRRHPVFQRLLNDSTNAGKAALEERELRKQFLKVLYLYHGSSKPEQKTRHFASTLAAEFFNRARYEPFKKFMLEIEQSGRKLMRELLNDQDLSSKTQLFLSNSRWLEEEHLNLEFLLTKCSQLSVFYLDGNNFLKDKDIQNIPKQENLVSFDANTCNNVTGSFLNSWKTPNSLEKLDVSGCTKFQKSHLAPNLPKFSNLKSLKIGNLKLTDDDIKSLPELKKLEILDLSKNQALTDNSLKLLSKIQTLKEINLTGVKGITPAGLRELRTALPQATIKDDLA